VQTHRETMYIGYARTNLIGSRTSIVIAFVLSSVL